MQDIKGKRILCIVGSMDAGGAETFLMKMYRAIDRNNYQFDFLVSVDKEGFYDQEILAMGGKIYYSKSKSVDFIKYVYGIYSIVKKNQYKYVLRMASNSFATLDLLIAKMAGAEQLIMRATNAGDTSGFSGRLLHKLFSWMPKIIPTVKFAPSTEAAEFLFGKCCVSNGKVTLLKNAIFLTCYKYDENMRNEIRKEFNIINDFVIGHVGRFNKQKNHKFLIEVFFEVVKVKPEAKLMLIGKGELESDIKNQLLALGLSEKVILTGVRRDVPALLMSMDVMVFPSLFEGMPNVIIEAQATGLPCLLSDVITKEAKITNTVSYMSTTNNKPFEWAYRAIKIGEENVCREAINEEVRKSGYDIKNSVEEFAKNCI